MALLDAMWPASHSFVSSLALERTMLAVPEEYPVGTV
jgi:hypothetical protein